MEVGRSGFGRVRTGLIIIKLNSNAVGYHQVILEEIHGHGMVPESSGRLEFGG